MDKERFERFYEDLWGYYSEAGRNDLPWRLSEEDGCFDPYKIMVSELMLQQTQVARVVPKYHTFLERFPTVQALASAELGDVIIAWQGLGYNRRAKFLWRAAQVVSDELVGVFPDTPDDLVALPGVGKNTAGAIATYAYNAPVLFIETNIRTVYIYHFFQDQTGVSDPAILQTLDMTLDRTRPREFYWALMDYGSFLKRTVGNLSVQSKQYVRQPPFEGSRRQVRGKVLRLLTEGSRSYKVLRQTIPDARLDQVLKDLLSEQLIVYHEPNYSLA